MVSDEKFTEILRRLLAKSEAGKVRWSVTDKGSYRVDLAGDATILLSFTSPNSEPDFYTAVLGIGKRAVSTLLEENAEEESETFALLRKLYNDAERSYWGWDKALKRIDEALESDEIIGDVPQNTAPQKSAPPVDDLPF